MLLVLLLLGLFNLGELVAAWHESQLEEHAAGASCDVCLAGKPLKYSALAVTPQLISLSPVRLTPQLAVYTGKPALDTIPVYHSRAPPFLV